MQLSDDEINLLNASYGWATQLPAEEYDRRNELLNKMVKEIHKDPFVIMNWKSADVFEHPCIVDALRCRKNHEDRVPYSKNINEDDQKGIASSYPDLIGYITNLTKKTFFDSLVERKSLPVKMDLFYKDLINQFSPVERSLSILANQFVYVYLNDLTEFELSLALSKNGWAIETIKNPTPAQKILALNAHPACISVIKEPTIQDQWLVISIMEKDKFQNSSLVFRNFKKFDPSIVEYLAVKFPYEFLNNFDQKIDLCLMALKSESNYDNKHISKHRLVKIVKGNSLEETIQLLEEKQKILSLMKAVS